MESMWMQKPVHEMLSSVIIKGTSASPLVLPFYHLSPNLIQHTHVTTPCGYVYLWLPKPLNKSESDWTRIHCALIVKREFSQHTKNLSCEPQHHADVWREQCPSPNNQVWTKREPCGQSCRPSTKHSGSPSNRLRNTIWSQNLMSNFLVLPVPVVGST